MATMRFAISVWMAALLSACISPRLPIGQTPSVALSDPTTGAGAAVWIGSPGRVQGAVLTRDPTDSAGPISALSVNPGTRPKIVASPTGFFIAWLQGGRVFRQITDPQLGTSSPPMGITDENILDYDIGFSSLDNKVVMAAMTRSQVTLRTVDARGATATLFSRDARPTSFTLSSATDTTLAVRHLLAWTTSGLVRFVLTDPNGHVLHEGQLTEPAVAIGPGHVETSESLRSAYDPVDRRFILVLSRAGSIRSVLVFPETGTVGEMLRVRDRIYVPPPQPETVWLDSRGQRWRERGRTDASQYLSAVTGTGASTTGSARFRLSFVEAVRYTYMYSPATFPFSGLPPRDRYESWSGAYTLDLTEVGAPLGAPVQRGAFVDTMAQSREVANTQILIFPISHPPLQEILGIEPYQQILWVP